MRDGEAAHPSGRAPPFSHSRPCGWSVAEQESGGVGEGTQCWVAQRRRGGGGRGEGQKARPCRPAERSQTVASAPPNGDFSPHDEGGHPPGAIFPEIGTALLCPWPLPLPPPWSRSRSEVLILSVSL